MSHRKVHSQGNVPFSWEDSPGISKASHQDTTLHVLNLSSSSPKPTSFIPHDSDTSSLKESSAHQDKKIPLPPCKNLQLPTQRSTSAKGFGCWQEDPFIAAFKECTKNVRNGNKVQPCENKKNVTGFKVKNSRLVFSCKNSCDVTDDNLVRLSHLPPIPRYRVRG